MMSDTKGVRTDRRERRFLTLMAAPLVVYLLIVLALLVTNILYVGPRVDWRALTVSWEGPAKFWRTITSPEIRFALRLSLVTSAMSVVLSMLIAIPTGYVLSRRRFFGAVVIDTVLDIPIVLPPLVVGLSLLVFFSTGAGKWLEAHGLKLIFQPAGIVAAQFVVAWAFASRTMKAT